MNVYKNTWSGAVLLSLILLAYFLVVPGKSDLEGDPFEDPSLLRILRSPAGRISSARSGARLAEWAEGSSGVLSDLASCLEAAELYVVPPAASAGEQPLFGSPPGDVNAYYRDVCLARVAGPIWTSFVLAYGERPRAWVLQLLAAAEDDYDRLRLEPDMRDDEAWRTAFAHAPARIRALRQHLVAVYPLAASASGIETVVLGPRGGPVEQLEDQP